MLSFRRDMAVRGNTTSFTKTPNIDFVYIQDPDLGSYLVTADGRELYLRLSAPAERIMDLYELQPYSGGSCSGSSGQQSRLH